MCDRWLDGHTRFTVSHRIHPCDVKFTACSYIEGYVLKAEQSYNNKFRLNQLCVYYGREREREIRSEYVCVHVPNQWDEVEIFNDTIRGVTNQFICHLPQLVSLPPSPSGLAHPSQSLTSPLIRSVASWAVNHILSMLRKINVWITE